MIRYYFSHNININSLFPFSYKQELWINRNSEINLIEIINNLPIMSNTDLIFHNTLDFLFTKKSQFCFILVN